jgi:hypothetical protein
MPKDRLQARFANEVAGQPLYSPLGIWMREHRAELEQMLQGKRPDWADLARHFGNAKLRDHTGQLPTASTARLIWKMVLQDERRPAQPQPAHRIG